MGYACIYTRVCACVCFGCAQVHVSMYGTGRDKFCYFFNYVKSLLPFYRMI